MSVQVKIKNQKNETDLLSDKATLVKGIKKGKHEELRMLRQKIEIAWDKFEQLEAEEDLDRNIFKKLVVEGNDLTQKTTCKLEKCQNIRDIARSKSPNFMRSSLPHQPLKNSNNSLQKIKKNQNHNKELTLSNLNNSLATLTQSMFIEEPKVQNRVNDISQQLSPRQNLKQFHQKLKNSSPKIQKPLQCSNNLKQKKMFDQKFVFIGVLFTIILTILLNKAFGQTI